MLISRKTYTLAKEDEKFKLRNPAALIAALIEEHKKLGHGICEDSCDVVAGMKAALKAVSDEGY